MAKKVLANGPYIYAWAAKEYKQKAAKIPGETVLSIIAVEGGWAEIEKLPAGTYSGYPTEAAKWFIGDENPRDWHEIVLPPVVPPVEPPVAGAVTDEQAAQAIVTILKWIKT